MFKTDFISVFRHKLLVIVCLAGLFMSNCSNELNVTADWKEQMVVYAVFNREEPIHYIRISRGYLDPQTNALVLAKNPDSIYATGLDVRIEEYEQNPNGSRGRRTSRPDIIARDTLLNNKDTGIFVSPELLAYYFTATLQTNFIYRVVVKTPTGLTVFGETPIVGTAILARPLAPAPNTPGVDYSSTAGVQISFRMPENGTMANLNARIFYDEYLTSDPNNKVRKFVDYPILNNARTSRATTTSEITTRIRPNQYFGFLANQLPVNRDLRRDFLGMEFNTAVASEDFANFIIIGGNSSTLVQVRPEFTNVVNGLGIVGSRANAPYLPNLENQPDYPQNSNWFRRARRDQAGLDSLCRNYPQLNFCSP